MTTIPYLLATAGHVDHGKSTLVKALTGVDPDRLPEEKARGITIDLGFAPLWLEHPNNAGARLQVGIVDVPGHEDFITTMAAGTGAADGALLVVAANEGWMPQTQEHFEILQYQCISRLLVTITKADTGSVEEVRKDIARRLAGTRFARAAVVAVSAMRGAGIEELKRRLAEMLLSAPPRPDTGKPRLFVDRVFSRAGMGTIVTGSLVGGSLSAQMQVRLEPPGNDVKIRMLHTHGSAAERVLPGMRVAANLPDVPAHGTGAPQRGDVVTSTTCAGSTDCFDAALWRLAAGERSACDVQIRNGMHVRLQVGTADLGAKLLVLDRAGIQAGETGLVQVRCERRVSAFVGDCFVVRDWSKRRTLAGGRVLVLDAPQRRLRAADRLQRLARMAASIEDVETLVAEVVPVAGAVRRKDILLRSRWSNDQVAAAVNKAEADGMLVGAGNWVCRRTWFDTLCCKTLELVTRWHEERPTEAGMPLTEWKGAMTPIEAPAELLQRVLEASSKTVEAQENRIRLRSHRPQLPAYLAGAERRLREELARHPFDPPSRPQLAPDLRSQQALDYLVAVGDVVPITATVVLSREAFQEAVVRVRRFLHGHSGATVAEIKQVLGSNRRVMVPLLEMLDARGVTKRKGDLRLLCETEPLPRHSVCKGASA